MWISSLILLLVLKNGNSQSYQEEYPATTRYPWNQPENKNQIENNYPYDTNIGTNIYEQSGDTAINHATYFIVAPRLCRPGQVYRVVVNILHSPLPLTVSASIHYNGGQISGDSEEVQVGIPATLLLRMPSRFPKADYKLRVEGHYNGATGGQAFVNETSLAFSQRSMTIFIQMDKPVYMQGQNVRFRAVPINTELKAFSDPIDIYIRDPHGRIMRRWLSRQSNLGVVWLSYQLSDQPVYGEWSIEVLMQGQTEVKKFLIEEYYQTRFEVNVTMPAFFFNDDEYFHGIVQANYTSGAPVKGNLTLRANFKSLNNQYSRVADSEERTIPDYYFQFHEEFPPWSKYYSDDYSSPILKYFDGTYHFRYSMHDLLSHAGVQDNLQVEITATVGERFLDEIIVGYSTARIYNSSIRVQFFGGTPQVFKPTMSHTLHLVTSFHDGSGLRDSQYLNSRMRISAEIDASTGHRTLDWSDFHPIQESPGIWSVKIDLRQQLNLSKRETKRILNSVRAMTVVADFIDGENHQTRADLRLFAHNSPQDKHIKVTTSTKHPTVGNYLILHVQANYHIDTFNYIIMSKGSIILSGQDIMDQGIRTISIPLSPEMAPVTTAVVYHADANGIIVADSLTIPVNGISRNNFTIYINNKKARTGERVEVAIYGEPGAYVALSATDRAFYSMQAGNELSYAEVISKMAYFDEETNGTHSFSWLHHNGDPDDTIHFPSSTYGIDVNRTFEFIGLVVFSDATLHRNPSTCNISRGELECLTGSCYPIEKKCDGDRDCSDGTDEALCSFRNATDLMHFRKYRFNRIQRQYENVWLWHNINIGPHGRYMFNIDVPRRPVQWMITAFSMSPSRGFGMLPKAIQYTGTLPFFINIEMPQKCRQGEQVGVRVSIFNYLADNIEVTVILKASPDYKFVHVEEGGIVKSYNPRTSFGEHEFFIWIPKHDASVVYLPIVPTKLGDIKVRVQALTVLGQDSVEATLYVESDGLPQYRHESTLLDLSTRAVVPIYMHTNVTQDPIIPYAEDRYYIINSNIGKITVVGDVVGPIFPTMPVNASSLMRLPMDSAEPNMFSFAANMYTTWYMRKLSQRNREQEKKSFHYMNIGYQRQLSFMNKNGSFSLFRSDWNQSAPSVWLTAFCVRIFQEANFFEWENDIYIDPNVIESSVAWLLNYQREDGAFYEATWLPDRKMNSSKFDSLDDDQYRYKNISLTAHVLIALTSVQNKINTKLNARLASRSKLATQYLEKNLNLLSKNGGTPFEVAITTYALSRAESPKASDAFRILQSIEKEDTEYIYWGREDVPLPPSKPENQKQFSLPRLPYKYDSENIETTAYGLLVYISQKRPDGLLKIVKWLNSQRLTEGGWASTQDTVWAMKALIEYSTTLRIREVSNLTVTIEPTALRQSKKFFINDKNIAKLQTLDLPKAWGTVQVRAQGNGFGILQMSVQYNVDLERFQTQPLVKSFDLVVKPNFYGKNQSHIRYESCQSWTNVDESSRSGMAVLDITIPTGYIIQQQTLDRYIRSQRVRNLQRARFAGDKVLFYFDYLDSEETCVNFTIERWYPVANMSRFLPVRVYDYYAPERFNESIFDAVSVYLLNICEVCGSSQCPYCPIYNSAIIISTPVSFIIFCIIATAVRYFRTQEFSVG